MRAMEKAERRVNGPMAGQALEKLQSFFEKAAKLTVHQAHSLFSIRVSFMS